MEKPWQDMGVLKIKSNECNRTNIFYWMTAVENYRLLARTKTQTYFDFVIDFKL